MFRITIKKIVLSSITILMPFALSYAGGDKYLMQSSEGSLIHESGYLYKLIIPTKKIDKILTYSTDKTKISYIPAKHFTQLFSPNYCPSVVLSSRNNAFSVVRTRVQNNEMIFNLRWLPDHGSKPKSYHGYIEGLFGNMNDSCNRSK